MSSEKKVVTRFAPSPTGFMHVGGVRTALFAYLFAKQNNGTFILRIEDTDKDREMEGSIDQIIESLQWLGLSWDEGPDIGGPHAPYIQSERLATYKKYADLLYEKGLAYTDPYTIEELDAFRKKADDEKRPFLYRDYRPPNADHAGDVNRDIVRDETKPLRLKIQDIKNYKWNDLVRGELEAGEEALDDFILVKSDGYPTYNFAHIIDDMLMGVTHIFRADEFISSTPKFLALYEALGIEHPEFATLPPILGPDGKKKLSKRDGAKDLLEYKKEGFLPDAFFNFLAFIGWNPGGEQEIMSREEIIKSFDIGKIQKGGAKFNEEKLIWTNKEYLKNLPFETQKAEICKKLPEEVRDLPIIDKLVPVIKERISKWSDIETMIKEGELDYYFTRPNIEKEKLICDERMRKGKEVWYEDVKEHLKKIAELLQKIPKEEWNAIKVKEAIWDYATDEGRGIVLWAMRYALSGREHSPDPFSLADIFGKEETLTRLESSSNL